jgi:hypothetical protein
MNKHTANVFEVLRCFQVVLQIPECAHEAFLDTLNLGFDNLLKFIKDTLKQCYPRVGTWCNYCIRKITIPMIMEINKRKLKIQAKRPLILVARYTEQELAAREMFWKAYCLTYYYHQRNSTKPNRNNLECRRKQMSP